MTQQQSTPSPRPAIEKIRYFDASSEIEKPLGTLVESLVQMTTFDFTNFLEIGPFIYYNFSKNSSNQGVVE